MRGYQKELRKIGHLRHVLATQLEKLEQREAVLLARLNTQQKGGRR